jgi:alpha-ketoglutarate-dependent taurine dioxygenase
MIGIFDTAEDREIAARRRRVLHRLEWYPEPEESGSNAVIVACAGDLPSKISAIKEQLAEAGFAVVRLDRPLDDGEFLELGRSFGSLIPEAASEITDFVSRRYILDIRAVLPAGAPVDRQPFAADPLTFHTEGSRWPEAHQPTLLAFHCITPSRPGRGAQTLLRSAAQVSTMLPARSLATLAEVAYDVRGAPPVYREAGGGIFSFRDCGTGTVPWRMVRGSSGRTPGEVAAALRDLLLALYDEPHVRGIRWEPNSLVLVSNHRFFHGRSAAGGDLASQPRHLRRLRIR